MLNQFHQFLPYCIRFLSFFIIFTTPLEASKKVRAIFIEQGNIKHSNVLLFVNGSAIKIELPQWNFSAEVDLPDGELDVAVISTLPAEGKPIPVNSPKIKIPESWSRCLLVFIPDPANKEFPAKVIPVNADSANFPKGNTMIYNLTSATIVGKFGSESVKVLPRKSASYKSPIPDFGNYIADISCYLPGNKESIPICRSNWFHNPKARQILFVTPSSNSKVPRVWGVRDHDIVEKPNKND
jgi:hypothetical protein